MACRRYVLRQTRCTQTIIWWETLCRRDDSGPNDRKLFDSQEVWNGEVMTRVWKTSNDGLGGGGHPSQIEGFVKKLFCKIGTIFRNFHKCYTYV
ncbi:hypothetical protein NPIL_375711 [Nephila pilipes]|uniref:Uncharacterized protein n=1 Tax=Nephila pilipes TaxID=299642 RepID=A0A8X6MVQ9_NEPPI|nr:hypothetical protein NPIL_375711 [Nephila pilipes]